MSYYDDNRDLLRELFRALGKEQDWSDDADTFVSHTLPRWLGTEHGSVGDKEPFTDQQIAAARPILAQLGLTERIDPPTSNYDEVVVLGAAGIGLHRRLELVRTTGVRAPVLTVLAGMRPHLGAAGAGRDGGMAELLAREGRFGAADGWTTPPRLTYLARLLAEGGLDDDRGAQVLFPSETDLAQLLVSKQWPDSRLTRVVPSTARHEAENDELGQRTVQRYEYDGPLELPLIRIINGPPVVRPHGPPRPTTTSTLQEWLSMLPELPDPRRVLFVVNQPHLGRVGLDIHDQLGPSRQLRIDVELSGCATLSDVSIHLLLGEIPARIALEQRRAGPQ